MPVFNGELCIGNAIESLINQTFANWELLIIDDGSKDSTRRISEAYSAMDLRVRFFSRNEGISKGAPSCRNLGLTKAVGEYVLFLDSDDELKLFCLEQRINAIRNTDLSWAIFLQDYFDDSSKCKGIFNMPITGRYELIRAYLELDTPWQTSAPIWKREFLLDLSGFDVKYLRMEDPDLHLRALLRDDNYKCFYDLPSDCIYYLRQVSDIRKNEINDSVINDCYLLFSKILLEFRDVSIISEVKCSILSGYNVVLSSFVLHRINTNYQMNRKVIQLLLRENVINFFMALKYWVIVTIYKNDNALFRMCKLKGVIYKFYFDK